MIMYYSLYNIQILLVNSTQNLWKLNNTNFSFLDLPFRTIFLWNHESNKTGINFKQEFLLINTRWKAPRGRKNIFLIDLHRTLTWKKSKQGSAIEGTWQPSITDPSPIHWLNPLSVDHRREKQTNLTAYLENLGEEGRKRMKRGMKNSS